MERLTAEDRLMLWPDELWPQEIGALAVLDGATLLDADGRFRVEAVRRAVEARLHLVPRLRQLLRVPPRGLGGPLWVDATAFDLDDHVRVVPLPAPGDEAALLAAAEQLRRRRLDRSRPLWEMSLLPGLSGGRVGLFVRLHHAMADGIAGVATIGAFLDEVPDAPAAPAPPWTPAPPPTAWQLLGDNLRRRARALGSAFATLARPLATARTVLAARAAMRGLLAGEPTPPTSLDRTIGPDRTLAVVRGSLDEVKGAAHAHGATVNDVLLAVVAAGLRSLLHGRHEPIPEVVPVYVPMTLRHGRFAQARGNDIGQMVVRLPVGVADPGRRLRLIAGETAQEKARSHPHLGAMMSGRLARRAVLKVLDRHPVSVTTADVPGPPRPAYLAGARLLEVFPVLPLVARVSLGVGGLSYAGQFTITAVADRDAVPDLEVFTAGVRDELTALTAATAASLAR